MSDENRRKEEDNKKEHSSPKRDDSPPAVMPSIHISSKGWIEKKVLQKGICRICLLDPFQESLKKWKK